MNKFLIAASLTALCAAPVFAAEDTAPTTRSILSAR